MIQTVWNKHLGKLAILLLLIAYFSKSLTTTTRHALRGPFVQRITHIKFDREHVQASTWSFTGDDLGANSKRRPIVQIYNHLSYSGYVLRFPIYSTEALSCHYSGNETGESQQPKDQLTAAQDAEKVLDVLNEIETTPDWARNQESITTLLLSGAIKRTQIEWLSLAGLSIRAVTLLSAVAFLWIVFRRELMANRRVRWRESRCCAHCGYRVQSEYGICPECGVNQGEAEP